MSRAAAEDDDDEDEAGRALEAARDFADAGKYAEALERHEWFHHNALRIDRSYYGVRLSFALSYWMELAEQYPPALASLKAIRNANTKELIAGKADGHRFHDVVSINRTLGEVGATITLFELLNAKRPAFAKECFRFAEDTLIHEEEVELFTKYGGHCLDKLKEKIRLHREVMKPVAGHPIPEHSIKMLEDQCVEYVLKLIAMATRQRDGITVARQKDLAYKAVPDPRIRP